MTLIAWLVLGIVFIIAEIATASIFFFACFAIGAFAAAAVSLLSVSDLISVGIFVIVSILSMFTIRPLFKKWFSSKPDIKSNVDELIGKTATVTKKITPHEDGFVKVTGAEVWLASSAQTLNEGETVIVKSVTGTKLTVGK